MVETQKLNELQLRKQTLLLESDLHRLTFLVDCGKLRGATNVVGRVAELRRAVGPWALVLAPIAGVAIAMALRRKKAAASESGGSGWFSQALTALPVVLDLWRKFNPPADEAK